MRRTAWSVLLAMAALALAGSVVVIDTAADEVAGELSPVSPLTQDPSPDLPALAPSGNRMFTTLRGSLPPTGEPHASTGSAPGVGVIRV